MKKFSKIITLMLSVVMLFSMTSASAYATNSNQVFSDVSSDAWYYEAVNTMAQNGLLAGYSDGLFHPDDPITYGQFATILCRVTGTSTDNPKHWHGAMLCTSTHWAAGALLQMDGTNVFGRFCKDADEKLWRGEALEALTILARHMPAYNFSYKTQVSEKIWTLNDIPDANAINTKCHMPHIWTNTHILYAYNLGLTAGTDSRGTCNPAGIVSRAQLCQMLYNMGINSPNSVTIRNSGGIYGG